MAVDASTQATSGTRQDTHSQQWWMIQRQDIVRHLGLPRQLLQCPDTWQLVCSNQNHISWSGRELCVSTLADNHKTTK